MPTTEERAAGEHDRDAWESAEDAARRLEREAAADESFDGLHMDCDGIPYVMTYALRDDRARIAARLRREVLAYLRHPATLRTHVERLLADLERA